NGIDFTGRFRELAVAIALLPTSTLILDGEVAVFDEHLLSRRDWLRRPDPRAVVTPPIFITFDCAHADGRDLRHYPLGQDAKSSRPCSLAKDSSSRRAAFPPTAWKPGRRSSGEATRG